MTAMTSQASVSANPVWEDHSVMRAWLDSGESLPEDARNVNRVISPVMSVIPTPVDVFVLS